MISACNMQVFNSPAPVFLPGTFHGWRSLAGYSPWGHKESDTTWQLNNSSNKKLKEEWNSSTLATSCEELTHWKRLWCWEGLGAGGEGDVRGWDGWMASPTWWTWVWVKSGRWWWTGRPGVLRFMGSQRVGHDWATELNWTELKVYELKLPENSFPWAYWYLSYWQLGRNPTEMLLRICDSEYTLGLFESWP